MSFDIEYVLTQCDHRIHDMRIQPAVNQEMHLIDGTMVCGDFYAGDEELGGAIYTSTTNMGTKGIFEPQGNDTVKATISLDITPAANPRLFIRKPGEYNRTEIHPNSYFSTTDYVVYGGGVYYGTNTTYKDTVDTHSSQTLWKVNYRNNSIIIYNYDNQYDWYLDCTVAKDACPYCSGDGVENDLSFNSIGRINIVTDTDKLVQTVMKALLTDKGKNPNFPSYGTIIKSLIGQKFMLSGFVLRQEIMDQLEAIKQNQMSVMQAFPELYSPYEVLYDIMGVQLIPQSDPRKLAFKIVLKSLALDKVETKTLTLSA